MSSSLFSYTRHGHHILRDFIYNSNIHDGRRIRDKSRCVCVCVLQKKNPTESILDEINHV